MGLCNKNLFHETFCQFSNSEIAHKILLVYFQALFNVAFPEFTKAKQVLQNV